MAEGLGCCIAADKQRVQNSVTGADRNDFAKLVIPHIKIA